MFIKTRGIVYVTGLAILSAGAGLTLGSLPVQAFQPGEEIRAFSTTELISEEIRKRLSRKFNRRNRAMQARGDLAAFYSERDYKPVWITDGQLNSKARQVIDELARAGKYGLDPEDYRTPVLNDNADDSLVDELAKAELMISGKALKYMRDANGERIDQTRLSRFLDRKAKPLDATEKLGGLADADDPARYLTSLHPQNRQFKALMAALAAEKNGSADSEPGERIRIPRGPVLRYGMKHPQVALVRRRLGVPVLNNLIDPRVYGSRLREAVIRFQKSAGLPAEGIIGVKTRFALNAPKPDRHKQIIANMERWRWMPRNLGATHVRVNIPEYKVRVVRNDEIIHEERVIVGKPTNKTPVFSDEMETVVFNPYWNVPQSIIWNEMNGRIPAGYEGGYRNGRMWIRQTPGPRNALGRVKFLFPNKHAVYMHDTPSKSLFSRGRRAFSHGCVRVRNPRRLAEVVFGINGWSKAQVSRRWASRSNQQVQLKKKIPVHITYFTLWADKDGNLQSFGDVYGHDNRIYAAVTKGVAWARAHFPEVRKVKIQPRVAAYDDYSSDGYTNDWWFPSANSSSYWSGRNVRQQKRRVRVYRKQKRRKKMAFDEFFSLF